MNIFQFLWQGYHATLIDGVNNVVASGLAAVAATLHGALILYVMITGVLLLLGYQPWQTASRRMIRAVLVAAILTPVYFNQFIRDTFLTTVPNWIAQAIGGQPTQNAAHEFDLLADAANHYAAGIKAQASGIFYIGAQVEIALCMACIGIALIISFIIWFIANALLAVMVSIGPFVLVGYLFDSTRGVADRWIGKMIGLLLLMLLVSVVLQIVMTQNVAYMRQAGAGTGGIAEQIAILWDIARCFGVGSGLMLLLPSIAALIGGGISFNPTTVLALAAGRVRR